MQSQTYACILNMLIDVILYFGGFNSSDDFFHYLFYPIITSEAYNLFSKACSPTEIYVYHFFISDKINNEKII